MHFICNPKYDYNNLLYQQSKQSKKRNLQQIFLPVLIFIRIKLTKQLLPVVLPNQPNYNCKMNATNLSLESLIFTFGI